jgi:hypothetical protein
MVAIEATEFISSVRVAIRDSRFAIASRGDVVELRDDAA